MIKTIKATNLRNNFSEAHGYVKRTKKPLVVTERGIPKSVLVDIDEYEDYLSEKDANLLKQIKSAKQEKKDGKLFSVDDVFADVL